MILRIAQKHPRCCVSTATTYHKQQASTVIMVLLVLVGLLTSSLMMFRSTDLTNLIAGNMASQSAATTLGDIGVVNAVNTLKAITDFDTATGQYYPLQQPQDAYGLPTGVDWTTIPVQIVQNYRVQYILERLCTGVVPIANPDTQCTTRSSAIGGSKKISGVSIGLNNYYYRATIRISGNKNALSYVQAILVK